MTDAKIITSAANPLVKRIRGLDLKKNREDERVCVVEGVRHIDDALRAGWRPETVVYTKRFTGKIDGGAQAEVTEDLMQKMTGRDNPQPVLAVFPQVWAGLDAVADGIWVVLEAVRDPGNLGTIIRTADATGARGIMLVGSTCDPFAPEVMRATVGSFARVAYVRTGLDEFLAWRKNWRGMMVGTHLQDAAKDYRDIDYKTPLLIAMGTEQSGLSDGMAAACGICAKIPMRGGAESLNLGIATGLMLYEAVRKDI